MEETFDSQLAFEVLHDVQKLVVHLRLLRKLKLDGVQVAQRVADIERPVAR